MTITEYLRKRIEDYTFIGKIGHRKGSLEDLRKSEWCEQFIIYMRNRLLMGYFRYGPMGKKPGYDNVGSAKKRLDLYEKTGNLEHLVDVANLMMCEFVDGKHPNRHFYSTDDGIHVEKKE